MTLCWKCVREEEKRGSSYLHTGRRNGSRKCKLVKIYLIFCTKVSCGLLPVITSMLQAPGCWVERHGNQHLHPRLLLFRATQAGSHTVRTTGWTIGGVKVPVTLTHGAYLWSLYRCPFPRVEGTLRYLQSHSLHHHLLSQWRLPFLFSSRFSHQRISILCNDGECLSTKHSICS